MANKKKRKPVPSLLGAPSAADRKAQNLLEQYSRGVLSERQVFDALDRMRRAGPIGPGASFIFVQSYLAVFSLDCWILSYIEKLSKTYPSNALLPAISIQVERELNLNALVLDSFERLEAISTDDPISIQFRNEADAALAAIDSTGASWQNDRPFLVTMDRARQDVIMGRPAEAAQKIAMVLSERPLWVPALEAKAEIAWDSCQLEAAETAFALLLKADPRSAAGLLGMTRLLLIKGRSTEAYSCMPAILAGSTFAFDPDLTLEMVLATGKTAEASENLLSSVQKALNLGWAPDYFRHLAASLYLLRKDEPAARALWKSIKKDSEVAGLSRSNLADLALAPEERYGPFIFRLQELLPVSCRMLLMPNRDTSALGQENALDRLCAALRLKLPEALKGYGEILVRHGDADSLQLLFSRVITPRFPEHDTYFLELCDNAAIPAMRRELLRPLLVSDGRTDLIRHSTWNITWDPVFSNEDAGIQHQKAQISLNTKKWDMAIKQYRELLRLDPDCVAAWNNLRFACEQTGATAEVQRLGQELRSRFPWYFLLQIEDAKTFDSDGMPEKAHRILDGLLARSTFHGDELRALVRAKMDTCLSQKQYSVALSWLELWGEFEVDTSRFEPYLFLRLARGSRKPKPKKPKSSDQKNETKPKKERQPKKGNPEKPDILPTQFSLF